jgi:hypothetical protein
LSRGAFFFPLHALFYLFFILFLFNFIILSHHLPGLDPIDEEINSRPGLYRTKTNALPDLSPETFNATVGSSGWVSGGVCL